MKYSYDGCEEGVVSASHSEGERRERERAAEGDEGRSKEKGTNERKKRRTRICMYATGENMDDKKRNPVQTTR